MNWILRAYADAYTVMLGQSENYRSAQKCDKHTGSGDKPHWRRRK